MTTEWEDRQQKRIALPPTDEELNDHNQWAAEYQDLREKGLERGWIDIGIEGDIHQGPKPSGYETREETDEEYESRMNSPFARLSWEMMKNVQEQLKKTSAALNFINTSDPSKAQTVVFPVAKREEK